MDVIYIIPREKEEIWRKELEKETVRPEFFDSCKCIGIYAPDYAIPDSTIEIAVELEGVALPLAKAECRAVLVDADTEEILAVGDRVDLANGERHTWTFKIRMPNRDLRVYALGQEEDPIVGWQTECRTDTIKIRAVSPEEAAFLKFGELALAGLVGAGIGYGLASLLDKDPTALAIGGAATGVAIDLYFRWRTILG